MIITATIITLVCNIPRKPPMLRVLSRLKDLVGFLDVGVVESGKSVRAAFSGKEHSRTVTAAALNSIRLA